MDIKGKRKSSSPNRSNVIKKSRGKEKSTDLNSNHSSESGPSCTNGSCAENGLSSQSSQKRPRLEDNNQFRLEDNSHSRLEDSSQSGSHVPKAGVMTKIIMKNFMCHSHMEVTLNKRVNFIVGKNGSGKSAILTAVVVGLGGKASATNRGNSLKELIKKGEQTASIEIHLCNTGSFRYKPQEYGDTIIVRRTISNGSGPASYKIMKATGQVVSTKREELDRIISMFNIQIDNPISVLNQDTARTFLNSSDGHEKYKFFMKATHLEEIEREYREANERKRSAMGFLKMRKTTLDQANQEVKTLEKKWRAVKQMSNVRTRERDLENELYWSVAITQEKATEEMERKLEEHRAKYPALKNLVDKESEEEKKILSQINQLEEQTAEIRVRLQACEKEHSNSREEEKRRKEGYTEKMREYKIMQQKIQRIQFNMNTLTHEIEKLQKNSEPDYVAKRQQVKLQITQLQEQLIDVRALLKTKKQHYIHMSSNIDKLRGDKNTLHQEISEQSRKIEQRRRGVEDLKRQANNALTVFGTWVPKVSQKIKDAVANGQFTMEPRGPLGAYINLRDASWAPAIESFLGTTLRSYCVNSSKDATLLTKIFEDVLGRERKPTIITSKFFEKVHDVRRNAVQSDAYPSLLNSLIIKDPVIANSLIDRREIESILLIPTVNEACSIMSQAHLVPRNCKRAVTKKGDQYYPDPNYRTYAGDGNTKAKFLQVSMKDAIRAAEDDLRRAQDQKEEMEKQMKAIQNQLQLELGELKREETVIKKLTDQQLQIQAKLSQLQDSEEPESNSIAELVGDLENLTRESDERKKEEGALDKETKKLKLQLEEAERNSSSIKTQAQGIQKEEKPILDQKLQLQTALKRVTDHKKSCEKKYIDIHKETKGLENELKDQQSAMKEAVDNALKICPRIETNRQPQVVEKELTDCRQYIKSVSAATGEADEVCSAYLEKKNRLDQIIEDLGELEAACNHLERMIRDRKRIYTACRKLTILRVQHMFQGLLHQRQYIGKIEIDNEKQSLELQVTPQEKNKCLTDTKSLSGGERSYTTVSFIMALWDAIEPPFYFLDEFDVFMDKVNRRVIMDLLLAHSRQKTNFQFVFFTPLETSNIQSNSYVTIHRMQAPNRSQRT